jgi:hypothetical protein
MAIPDTIWYVPNRQGSLVNAGNFNFVDNLGNAIVDNSQNHIVTTVYQYTSRPQTLWSNNPAYTSIQDEMGFMIQDETGHAILNEQST